MDTDVEIRKDLTPLIDASMVCGIQNHKVGSKALDQVSVDGYDLQSGQQASFFTIQAGFLYSEPNNPFILHCMKEMYNNGEKKFLLEDGNTNQFVIDWKMMIELSKFGAIYRDQEQWLHNIGLHLYDSSVFATRKSKTKDSYLIHWFDQSWTTNDSLRTKITKFIKQKLYWIFRKI